MKLKVKLDKGATMPSRAHAADAGLDLFAAEDVNIWPHSWQAVETGVHVAIPEGYVGLLTSKSGLMRNKGLTCRGTIDADYTGAIQAVLFNDSDVHIQIPKGNKVTQLVILPIITPDPVEVNELEETERGDGGFGSTGER
jgi:dUTP pyrophosphatase